MSDNTERMEELLNLRIDLLDEVESIIKMKIPQRNKSGLLREYFILLAHNEVRISEECKSVSLVFSIEDMVVNSIRKCQANYEIMDDVKKEEEKNDDEHIINKRIRQLRQRSKQLFKLKKEKGIHDIDPISEHLNNATHFLNYSHQIIPFDRTMLLMMDAVSRDMDEIESRINEYK